MESKIQNKLAIIAIFIGGYLGLLALYSSSTNQIAWLDSISLFTLVIGFIPIFFFILYILFLPLRYKQRNKNIFLLDVHQYYIDESKIDRLFDIGADLLIPVFIGGFSYFGVIKLIYVLNIKSSILASIIAILSYIIPLYFTKYIVKAERIDKDYHIGDGFIYLFKSIFGKIVSRNKNN